jgi:hypothetical protein
MFLGRQSVFPFPCFVDLESQRRKSKEIAAKKEKRKNELQANNPLKMQIRFLFF